MKRFIAVLLALMLLVTAALAEGKLEDEGFDKAEEAVTAYVQYFNEGDVEGMLSTFAIETYVDHVDADAYIEQQRGINFTQEQGIPVSNDYFRGIAIAKRYGAVADALYYQYMSFNLPEEYIGLADGKMLMMPDDASIAAFTDAMNDVPMSGWFGKIELKEIMDPNELSDMFGNERMQERIRAQEKVYGCDALVEMPALLNIGGTDYLLCMQCACYEGRWYNLNTNGNLSTLLGLYYRQGGLIAYDDLQEIS